jgi:integrase
MPTKAEGWLRRKEYKEGEVWLFCYDVPRPGSRPAENSKLIGLVKDFPHKADAEREAQRRGYWKLVHPTLSISPTFGELAQHFRTEELKRNGPLSKRAAETISTHESLLDGYILPEWGSKRALDMTVPMIEKWFENLATTPVGRTYGDGQEPPAGYIPEPLEWTSIVKIRSTMSLVFSHALRNKLLPGGEEVNPLRSAKDAGGVRCITVSDYEATVVTPEQMILILEFLNTETTQMEWTMALLHACTAVRPEEGFALKWSDIEWEKSLIHLNRAWSKGKVTDGKNSSALVPIAMDPVLARLLLEWRKQSPYARDDDWIFPSLTLKGKVPRSASSAAQDYLRPAAIYAGVIEEGSRKRFGWHNLRHSLATFLAGRVDPAVTMKMLRHRRISTTLEIYTHRSQEKELSAQGLYVSELKIGDGKSKPRSRMAAAPRVGGKEK